MNTYILILYLISFISHIYTNPIKLPISNAPISHIQWYSKSNLENNLNLNDLKPQSYHIQHMIYNNIKPPSKFMENYIVDNFNPANLNNEKKSNHFEYVISHLNVKTPKSLYILMDPLNTDDLSKFKLTDKFLDSLEKLTTPQPKRTSTKRTKKPNSATNRPKPHDKPQPRPYTGTYQKSEIVNPSDVSIYQPPVSGYDNEPSSLQNNNLAGQSQIGNRETQMVIKPTVIVNIKGTVSNSDSEIKLESKTNDNHVNRTIPQNLFNINQEVNLEKGYALSKDDPDSKRSKFYVKSKGNHEFRPVARYSKINTQNDTEFLNYDINKKSKQHTEISNKSLYDYQNESNRKLLSLSFLEKKSPRSIQIYQIGPLGGFINT